MKARGLANNRPSGGAFCGHEPVDLGGGDRARAARRARQRRVRLVDARGGVLEPDERAAHARGQHRGTHRHRQVPVPRHCPDRRAVVVVHQRLRARRVAGRPRAAVGPVAHPRSHADARGHQRAASHLLVRHHRSVHAAWPPRRLHGRAVVLDQRRLQLPADRGRHAHAGARPAPLSAAVSPADVVDHHRRPGALDRKPDLPDAARAGGGARHHAPRVHGIRRLLYARAVSLPVVRPRPGGARHGDREHGRRRARARRAALSCRSERGGRALHRLLARQPGTPDRRSGVVVERRGGRGSAVWPGPSRGGQDRAGAALLRDQGDGRARPPAAVRGMARDRPRYFQPPPHRGGTVRVRAADAGTAEVGKPHGARRRRRARLQQPADRHSRQRRAAGDAGGARLRPAARGGRDRHRRPARGRSRLEDARLLRRRPRRRRARRPRCAGARDGRPARRLGRAALHA